ncbi:tRNA epoxyqueuosine(34) reductase QueG [Thioclava kandeliae]|uniref:Epoxyqueuosine reductase n=1 Tax=Thioclava kandeliae TaxID=3070818 RepID=A0ABV1SFV2_9RHOB
MPSLTSDPYARLKERLNAQALAEGFSKMGITRPDAIPEAMERLRAFVEAGYHGDMGWMEERMNWRGAPDALWPEARSVIMLAETYTPDHDPMEVLNHPEQGGISVYAQGKDYHDLVKKRLKRVGRWLMDEAATLGDDPQIKVFVDTAPVMEKPLAQAAGLGWQGKHTNLLGRDLGSWFFLGAIFTTIPLTPDAPDTGHCGSCRACLNACPTNAFPAPYRLDARRCISYLTIEHKGPVPHDLRAMMGNRIYGCDDCLAACPWNKFAAEAREMRYQGPHRAPDLADLAALDDTAFRERFSGSPIKRIGRNRMVRNVLYAMGNSGRRDFIGQVQELTQDADETVSDAAHWALEQLKKAC